ncbi:MAG: hypothetical protein KAS71_14020 [Bacteroidales bacterium]|nr:hypothetical protein [Bacteroidales bacterium]
MKKIINLKLAALTILLALAAMPLSAQRGGGEGRGDRQNQDQMGGDRQGQNQGQRQQMTEASVKERVVRLAKALECTEEQKKKLTDYEVAQFKKTQKEREQYIGDRDAMRKYMQGQIKLRDEEYAKILTDDQMKKYNEMMEERRQQRPGGSRDQDSDVKRDRGRE